MFVSVLLATLVIKSESFTFHKAHQSIGYRDKNKSLQAAPARLEDNVDGVVYVNEKVRYPKCIQTTLHFSTN